MQNCEAILQSQEKSTEGFFLGRRISGVRRFVCADCRVEPGNDSVCGRRDFFVAGVNFPIRIFDSESTKRVKRPAFLR